MNTYKIIMLYNLDLYSVTCKLYLKKIREIVLIDKTNEH